MHKLTIEEKASLTSGATTWTSQAAGTIASMHMSDGPHGLRYQGSEGDSLGLGASVPSICFPTAAGLASTWDRDMIHKVGAALGEEARALHVSMLLGPGLNIKRSPLGGRNFEYASEDPFLAGTYGTAFVKGVQSQGVSAVPKHFAVNNQETDRFRVSADVDERTLREIYLPAFEMTVKQARPWAFMCSYNKVNGVYASQNHELLTKILRDEWGFDGVVVSDWGAVADRVAAVKAGLDIEMPPSNTDHKIVAAVRSGACDESVLDTVADRIALLAQRTQSSRTGEQHDLQSFAETHDELARKAAQESVVMLKNTGILPLSTSDTAPIAMIGEFARTPRYQGGGSSHVSAIRVHALVNELRSALPNRTITFAPGYALTQHDKSAEASDESDAQRYIDEAVDAANRAAIAIVNVGYFESDETEGADKTTIELSDAQNTLLEAVTATGTPTVVILSGGGVIQLGQWADKADAILEGWLLGEAGGAALADILIGAVSPSGHLNETIPQQLEDNPSYLHFPGSNGHVLYGEGLYVGYRYYDTLNLPVAYTFGFGLSYATFAYSNIKVEVIDGTHAKVSLTITNTGNCQAAAVPQIYVRSNQPDRPVHELKGFARIDLAPAESRSITVELDARAFASWNIEQHRWRVYAGDYTVEIGTSSRDIVSSTTISLDGDHYVAQLQTMSTLGEWLANPYGAQILKPFVDKVRESVADPSPEMAAIFAQMPLIKLASWGVGLDEQQIEAMATAAQRLAETASRQ
ncbi:glycoside hydrolase family 3 C-terminal domain-containing protein [Bifidobacterium aquikefiricola]|uniref:Glycoside hydrolase family 3 C-terminal domain-containing protein n=1 Tax=Bifidobacterium aquikefiricola TaxID=3059038 RepID=A0AB39U6U9_9BIFI